MANQPDVLLLDDGELHELAQLLESLHIPFTRRCGADATGEIAPPLDLVIATPERACSVRRGSPAWAEPDRPVRIIAVDEDSAAMRRKLKRLGFQLLVRLPAHDEVWRMLIERALRPADERQGASPSEPSSVAITTGRAQQTATLVDLANRGCRLESQREFRAGARMDFELVDAPHPEVLRLSGRLVRVAGELCASGRALHSAAMLFEDMPTQERLKLASLLNRWARGAESFSHAEGVSIPACDSPDTPELSLDDETDPPLLAGIEVELRLQPDFPGAAVEQPEQSQTDRRLDTRGDFPRRILAEGAGAERVLIGHNISVGGMRVDGGAGLHEGERFRIAIYGPAEFDPFTVDARVIRDDGSGGVALRFEDVPGEVAEKLEKLVACLPQVRSLEDGEGDPLGAVISQILAEL